MRPRSWWHWITVLSTAPYSLAVSELAIQARESLSLSFLLGDGSEFDGPIPDPTQEMESTTLNKVSAK